MNFLPLHLVRQPMQIPFFATPSIEQINILLCFYPQIFPNFSKNGKKSNFLPHFCLKSWIFCPPPPWTYEQHFIHQHQIYRKAKNVAQNYLFRWKILLFIHFGSFLYYALMVHPFISAGFSLGYDFIITYNTRKYAQSWHIVEAKWYKTEIW